MYTSDDADDMSSVVRGAVAKAIANIPRHLTMVELARRTAAEAPSRLVLPLGTKVRLKNDWNVPDYCALDPSIAWALLFRPAAGSVGFVSGNCFGSQEASIAISFPDEVKTTNGMSGEHFEPHLALNRSVLISDLEVLEYATYVGYSSRTVDAPLMTL